MSRRTARQTATDDALSAAHDVGRLRFDATSNRWLLTSFDAARAMVVDRSFDLAPVPIVAPEAGAGAIGAILSHASHIQSRWNDAHLRIRPVAAQALKPGSLTGFEAVVRDRARSLMDEVFTCQAGNLETAFVRPLLGDTFMDLLGVPQSRRAFVLNCGDKSGGFSDSSPERLQMAMAQSSVAQYFAGLLEDGPPEGAVILQTVVDALAARALDREEAVALLSHLLFGSLHTTPIALTFLLRQLTEPTLRQEIADGTISLDAAIEEAARLRSLRYMPGRVSTREIRLDDASIPAGASFGLDYNEINRDPARFAAPLAFDAGRERAGEMAFGGGLHLCVGRHLARIQMRAGAEVFLQDYHHLAAAGLCRLSGADAP